MQLFAIVITGVLVVAVILSTIANGLIAIGNVIQVVAR